MKVKHKDVVLFFVFVIEKITESQAAFLDASELLGHIGSTHNNPLIVFVNTANKQLLMGKESVFDDLVLTSDDGDVHDDSVYKTEAKEQAKYLFYDYLLRTSPEDSQDSSAEDTKSALRQALRKRCEAVVKCTKKCRRKENKYCRVNCKAVFDKLNLCEPLKKKNKKKKKNECESESDECGGGKRGRTMPPKWLI